jgi:DNA-binding NarL/FixJ family response regulator
MNFDKLGQCLIPSKINIMPRRIILLDDHNMIRKGMKLFLQLNLGCENITETGSCSELLITLKQAAYTHLILDIILTDGNALEIIPTIRNLYPNLKILVFSMQPPEVYGEALKQYGIRHYVSKTASEEEILNSLQDFMENKPRLVRDTDANGNQNPFSLLSPRELEILHYVLKGVGTKQISDMLNIKMNTVSTLKFRIYEKTGTSNIRELIELAILYNVNF